MNRYVGLAIMIGAACTARAQTFNIDIDPGGTAFGAGVPANSFGGAAETPGYWNGIQNVPGLTSTLRGLNGALTSVTLQTSGSIIIHSANDSSATGEFAKLMEDGWKTAGSGDSISYMLNGLAAGSYFVYTFGDAPDSNQQVSRVTINGSFQNVGGSHNSNEFVQNVTHARHFVELAAPGSITVSITNNPFVSGARAFLAGMQIEKLPNRLYVNAAAAPGGDGTTWATAFNRLQDAFTAVATYGGAIKEIWIRSGTYVPADVAFRGDTFDLPDGVAVYGGFAGTETEFSQRNVEANPVFLSGSIGGPLPTDNSYHVVTAWGCGYDTLLDGVTITSGYATGPFGWDSTGGGMYVRESQLTVRNCRFVGNYANRGGAVAVEDATPRFEECYFFGNQAEQLGGALYTLPGGAPTVVRCDFRVNRAIVNYGGAIAHYDGTNFNVFNCRFLDNEANWGGGAIYSFTGNLIVGNSIFTGNTGDADRGGAIHTFGDNTYVFVYNSSIWGNHAYQCGGVDAFADAKVYVRNSIVWGNTDDDPATNLEAAQLRRENAPDTLLSISYCDVEGWSGVLGGSGNFGADPQFVDPAGADGVVGTLDDDLRLLPTSPCIDRGRNANLPSDAGDVDDDNNLIEPLPLDMDDNARRVDVPTVADLGEGTAPMVDIGAYEFVPPCDLPGDLDHDGVIALNDLAILLSHFGTLSGATYEDGDLDADGDVDLTDLAVLLAGFGTMCG